MYSVPLFSELFELCDLMLASSLCEFCYVLFWVAHCVISVICAGVARFFGSTLCHKYYPDHSSVLCKFCDFSAACNVNSVIF